MEIKAQTEAQTTEIISHVIDDSRGTKLPKIFYENINNKSSLLRLLTALALTGSDEEIFEKAQKVENKDIEYYISFWDFDDKHKEHLVYGKFLLIELEAESIAFVGEANGFGQNFNCFKLADHTNYFTIVPLDQFKNNRLWLTFKWIIRNEAGQSIEEKWEGKNFFLRKLEPALDFLERLETQRSDGLPQLILNGAELAGGEKDFIVSNKRSSYINLPLNNDHFTSRYNALLSANLPVYPDDKTTVAKGLEERINYNGQQYVLSPDNCQKFNRYPLPCWEYQLAPEVLLKKTIYLDYEKNLTAVHYQLQAAGEIELIVRPLIEWRNFHQQTKAYQVEKYWPNCLKRVEGTKRKGFLFNADPEGNYTLEVISNNINCSYKERPEWRYSLSFAGDKERGMDDLGDAYAPGEFIFKLDQNINYGLLTLATDPSEGFDFYAGLDNEIQRQKNIIRLLPQEMKTDPQAKLLGLALDQFLTRRDGYWSLIAGYPWFREWGRDSMIVVRGLLSAGRWNEAREVIIQFAKLSDSGTFPNAINGNSTADRDTVDAPLLFILAVKEYVSVTQDEELLYFQIPDGRFILLILEEIFESLLQGASNRVVMDKKTGLIWSPSHYTWMDTSYPAATPREGYPVEIQAYWYAAVKYLEELYQDLGLIKKSKRCNSLAQKIYASFNELFWLNENYLADVILCGPDISAMMGTPNKIFRPNQLVAIAYGLVDQKKAKSIVDRTIKKLLLPGFLRSRSDDNFEEIFIPYLEGSRVKNYSYKPYGYYGQYTGEEDLSRKPAYHNGTGWQWLLGYFIEAFLFANDYSKYSIKRAMEFMEPVFEHLSKAGTIGSLSEICDGDHPHLPKGCSSQAWSVSETLRIYQLLHKCFNENIGS